MPGGKVEVTLKFAAPVASPQIFTTETPPRIAIDLADTRNGVSQRRIDVGAGATSGISAIEAAGRTRVVIDLFRPASYEKTENGNKLVLTVNSGIIGHRPSPRLPPPPPIRPRRCRRRASKSPTSISAAARTAKAASS